MVLAVAASRPHPEPNILFNQSNSFPHLGRALILVPASAGSLPHQFQVLLFQQDGQLIAEIGVGPSNAARLVERGQLRVICSPVTDPRKMRVLWDDLNWKVRRVVP